MTSLRVLGLLMLVALLGLACAGCGGTRLDGHGVLFVREDGQSPCNIEGPIYVWRPGSGISKLRQSQDVARAQDEKSGVQWSPDGKKIAFVSLAPDCEAVTSTGYEIWVAGANDVNGAKRAGTGTDPSWSPDGNRIVYAVQGSYDFVYRLRLLTLETGRWRPLHISGLEPVWGARGVAYVPDHKPKSIRLLNPKTGHSKPFASTPGNVKRLAWSRSGELAALVNGRLVLVYSASGRRITRFQAPQQTCGVTWSPDGKHLLITAGTLPAPNSPVKPFYWHVYEVDPAGRHWQLTPIRPSDCTISWR